MAEQCGVRGLVLTPLPSAAWGSFHGRQRQLQKHAVGAEACAARHGSSRLCDIEA